MNIYGVISNGTHIDTSKTEKGAKNYATRHGYTKVSIRFNCGYIAAEIAEKINGKWKTINNQ
jgi:hypothetical protein